MRIVRPFVLSLAVGLLIGVLYAALHVASPAPPPIALVGLLGMVVGERAVQSLRAIVRSRRTPSRKENAASDLE
jgi:XapX domain-containing protein